MVRSIDIQIGVGEKLSVGRQGKLADHLAGVIIQVEETVEKQGGQRAQVDNHHPQQRRAEQEQQDQPGAQVKIG